MLTGKHSKETRAESFRTRWDCFSAIRRKGFIDYRANNFKCTGPWKVYGDEGKARSLFAKYKKCTEIYCALWQSGSKLEQLAVAV